VLEGAQNAYRDIAVLNAAGALVVAGRTDDLAEGVGLAAAALESGRARDSLARLVEASNE
jgi:anthranilate phosphoribosyltransferase